MGVETYVCPRCGNQDESFLARNKQGRIYCRRCLSFNGSPAKPNLVRSLDSGLSLSYELSEDQKRLSRRLIENFLAGRDSLVHAVCGAGKTEIVLGVFELALRRGLQCGFAVPRRDVAIELHGRLASAFPGIRCTLVHGGRTNELTGDLIVLTTHQLYRYEQYFDLLVADEIDAFPYRGDFVLESFLRRSVRGRIVFMSATPPPEVVQEFSKEGREILRLDTRFHGHPIPVPRFVESLSIVQPFHAAYFARRYIRQRKPVFLFAPTIGECERCYRLISPFLPGGAFVHSEHPERARIIHDFREGRLRYLVTTSVLERGVTVKGLQALIILADQEAIYDRATLVQISGRVGRKKDEPEGEVLFLAERNTEAMKGAVDEIKKSNEALSHMRG